MNVTALPRCIDDFTFDRIFQPIVNRFPDAGPAGVARFFLTGDLIIHGMMHVSQTPHEYGWLLFHTVIRVLVSGGRYAASEAWFPQYPTGERPHLACALVADHADGYRPC